MSREARQWCLRGDHGRAITVKSDGHHVSADYAWRVLLVLADHADSQGRGARPSQVTICRETGTEWRQQVQRALALLVDQGLIVRTGAAVPKRHGTVFDLPLVSANSDWNSDTGARPSSARDSDGNSDWNSDWNSDTGARPKPLDPLDPKDPKSTSSTSACASEPEQTEDEEDDDSFLEIAKAATRALLTKRGGKVGNPRRWSATVVADLLSVARRWDRSKAEGMAPSELTYRLAVLGGDLDGKVSAWDLHKFKQHHGLDEPEPTASAVAEAGYGRTSDFCDGCSRWMSPGTCPHPEPADGCIRTAGRLADETPETRPETTRAETA